jgi:hypothetical protein
MGAASLRFAHNHHTEVEPETNSGRSALGVIGFPQPFDSRDKISFGQQPAPLHTEDLPRRKSQLVSCHGEFRVTAFLASRAGADHADKDRLHSATDPNPPRRTPEGSKADSQEESERRYTFIMNRDGKVSDLRRTAIPPLVTRRSESLKTWIEDPCVGL